MKSKIPFLIVFVFATVGMFAQVCTPDPAYTTPGIYPDSATNLPTTTDAVTSYATTITVVVPEDTSAFGFTFDYEYVKVDSIVGLPPSFTYTCSPSTCQFPGNSASCVQITGNPSVAGAGTYYFTAYVTAKLTNFFLGTIYESQEIDYYFIQINPGTCGTVTGVTTTSNTAGTVETIKWTYNGATSYKVVWRKTAGGGTGSSTTTGSSVNANGLSPCTSYKYAIRANCPDGNQYGKIGTFFTAGTICREGSDELLTSNDDVINIYPNPANNLLKAEYFSWDTKNHLMSIHNINGQIMMSENINMIEGINDIEFDISNYPTGIYLLKINDGEFEYATKFIKQ